VADVATIWARTDEGVRGFLVPRGTPGFESREIKQKLSLRASITGALFLQDVRVPSSAMLPLAEGLKAPLTCLSEARYGIVFGSVGAARDCLETTLAYAREREQFGKSLAAFQLTQEKLADMSLELSKAMLVALRLAELKDGPGVAPEQISVGKLNNVREALKIARTCRTILGGAGITLDHPPLRHANNLESVLTYEGTSEIHTLAIGQALTGVAAYR
jgi:glutaryl-CoA dehydrogenase